MPVMPPGIPATAPPGIPAIGPTSPRIPCTPAGREEREDRRRPIPSVRFLTVHSHTVAQCGTAPSAHNPGEREERGDGRRPIQSVRSLTVQSHSAVQRRAPITLERGRSEGTAARLWPCRGRRIISCPLHRLGKAVGSSRGSTHTCAFGRAEAVGSFRVPRIDSLKPSDHREGVRSARNTSGS
eukprot:284447-Prorocentrum_minimum.AAC.2